MKRITTKMFLPFLLALSIIFGGSTISTQTVPTVSAIGENNNEEHVEPSTTEVTPNLDPSKLPNPGETPSEEEEEGEGSPGSPGSPSGSGGGSGSTTKNTCQSESGVLGWIVCPSTGVVAKLIDGIYNIIHDLLVVKPLVIDPTSSIYQIWQYVRTITNVLSAILLLIVIYSQITGLGLSNYGIKRVLPRLIITIILVNLSFHICALAIDVSNIFGANLRGFFTHIADELYASGLSFTSADISTSSVLAAILSGGTIAGVVLSATGGIGALFWAFIPVLIGGVISVAAGLITIALRQALIALLVMISPLAFVAYLLPNTERWFTQWKNLFTRMLVFFPMFSLLFGASQLVGIALISSATNGFGIALGVGIQIIPLFFSVSLMKMSGTILGTINNSLQRLATPIRGTATRWSLEHQQRARDNYLNKSETPGAHLRQYLDYRRELRLQDSANAAEIRHSRAHHRAYIKAASYIGRDEQGNTTWAEKPNQYTRNAKTAAYYRTLAGNATANYQYTLSSYGTRFTNNNPVETRLNYEHGRAVEESMAQNYLAQNQAQADQDALLKSYLTANETKYRNRYEYNRLIKSAAGDLGHTGESSIIGQVIATNAMIEDRRKREADIISAKFGYDKPSFRAMLLDMGSVSDNGRETNDDGIEIEDEQYELLKDSNGNPLYQRRKWPHYIGVHKITHKEITKAEYDALPDTTTHYADGTIQQEGKDAYDRIRYSDIKNDEGNPTATIFMDDAGYMKTLLAKDIAIGDPINRRYLTTIGVAHTDYESTGDLRRYHSTITSNLNTTGYKTHAAGITPMITAQADRGFITTKSQFNIAEIQSLTAAGKAGHFLRNDGVNINELNDFVKAITDDTYFDKYFPIDDIWNYRNVNGFELNGWRLAYDQYGNKYWKEINRNDPNITKEDRKNYLRHKILPKFAAKLVGMLNRNITPGVLEDMKPDGLEALENILDTLSKLAIDNASANKLFEERMNGDYDIFNSNDPSILKEKIQYTQKQLRRIKNAMSDGDDSLDGATSPNHGSNSDNGSNNSNGGGGSGSGNNTGSGGYSGGNSPRGGGGYSGGGSGDSSYDSDPYRDYSGFMDIAEYTQRNDYYNIVKDIENIFRYRDYEDVAEQLMEYFNKVETLQLHTDDCYRLIELYRYDTAGKSDDEAIYNATHPYERMQQRLSGLKREILHLIDEIRIQ